MPARQSFRRVHRQPRPNHRRRPQQQSIAIIHSRGPSHLILRLWSREAMGSRIRRASRSHRLHGKPSSACDWSQSMACRHVHMASRSSSICSIMDQASSVDDSERAAVRDLLNARRTRVGARDTAWSSTSIRDHNDHNIIMW